jgi:anti-sigma factor RsiW
MNCAEYDTQLGDYVDGALDAAARERFEAHLATCERCRIVTSDFQVIRLTARTLEPQVPSAAVWTKISAALEQESRPWWSLGGSTVGNTGGSTFWQPAAALAMALVLTASLAWLGGRLAPVAETARLASARTASQTADTAGADRAPLANADLDVAAKEYASAIAGLEQITSEQRAALDPDTADVLTVNLTVIDTAIGESRAALETQPENETAIESLFEALRRKLALLQDAVTLINEMRKGNPEGAARVVSGLNQ